MNIKKNACLMSASLCMSSICYKYYLLYLSNNTLLGGIVPGWFILLLIMVPASPVVGKIVLILKNKTVNVDDDCLQDLIAKLKEEK